MLENSKNVYILVIGIQIVYMLMWWSNISVENNLTCFWLQLLHLRKLWNRYEMPIVYRITMQNFSVQLLEIRDQQFLGKYFYSVKK